MHNFSTKEQLSGDENVWSSNIKHVSAELTVPKIASGTPPSGQRSKQSRSAHTHTHTLHTLHTLTHTHTRHTHTHSRTLPPM